LEKSLKKTRTSCLKDLNGGIMHVVETGFRMKFLGELNLKEEQWEKFLEKLVRNMELILDVVCKKMK